ncbi:hypothetical protein PTSG_07341 [Salpingoeca rosetta]|uniref:J domain-containing protein n=1 Tax=Salpingoeca rosetta (strain ATCC 50818 / BSB-021) TaxID=946362 RepID=F2UJ51_SALR5|nr:uncharacterized protein PTSG_07341 [Salpingoeca rosetta]EGD76999.1 hypothetical protein PTSG_07341 [Salpingoeca rosetta]|eukprot:XP_004990839.1 hypothetical protein PTSG_07341 [Salpingoeca rosetta]
MLSGEMLASCALRGGGAVRVLCGGVRMLCGVRASRLQPWTQLRRVTGGSSVRANNPRAVFGAGTRWTQTRCISSSSTTRRAASSSAEGSVCWSCGKPAGASGAFFCAACGTIQPPHKGTPNYFSVLDLPAAFDVDLSKAEQTFRSLQTKLHPDRFGMKSEKEQEYSGQQSAVVNDAYNAIRTPLSRALHLLDLNGNGVAEQEKATDIEFLMEVMELNEQLAEATTEDALLAFEESLTARRDETLKTMADTFRAGDMAAAKEATLALRYFDNLQDQVHDRLDAV